MLTVIGAKMFLALLHRAGKVPLEIVSLVMSILCFLSVSVLFWLTRVFMAAQSDEEFKIQPWLRFLPRWMEKLSHKANPEVLVLNVLQVLLFFVCHSWAGLMINKDFWNKIFQDGEIKDVIVAILYISALLSLAGILPLCVPDFAAVTALPPFFSTSSEKMVVLVAVQVVDAKMVAARAQMAQQE